MDLTPTVDVVQPREPRSQADENALDDKLAAAAARNRHLAEERRRNNAPATVQEMLRSAGAFVARGPIEAPRGEPGRIPLSEGDQPEPTEALRTAIVPQRFRSVSFASYETSTRGQVVALDAATGWLARAIAGEPAMLALIGPQGTGKSHLLYSAANALLATHRRCYARPWYRLADELRYGGESPFALGKPLESHDVRAMLWKQRVVLVDEVRPTASTAFDDTELAKYSCHAYDAGLAVIITTNVHPLADVMGPAAASRYTQVVIDGPDRRQQ